MITRVFPPFVSIGEGVWLGIAVWMDTFYVFMIASQCSKGGLEFFCRDQMDCFPPVSSIVYLAIS